MGVAGWFLLGWTIGFIVGCGWGYYCGTRV